MRISLCLYPLLSCLLLGPALDASASTASERLERALALSQASQTVQRFFTCVAEGVNGDTDPERQARAASCMRNEFDKDGRLLFNGLEIEGVEAVIGIFTGAGLGAQQFEDSIFAVHTIVDEEFKEKRFLRPATIALRVNVFTTFRNALANSPALPLPLGEFTSQFVEFFLLEEQEPGRWVIVDVSAEPLANIPLADGSIVTPFPVIDSVEAQ